MTEQERIQRRLAELKQERQHLETRLNGVWTEIAQLRLRLLKLLAAQR